MYASTFYWPRLLTGYSGAFQRSYLVYDLLMRTFPDARSLEFLRDQSVGYVILHENEYGRAEYRRIVETLDRQTQLRQVARTTDDAAYEARIYRLDR